MNWDTTHHPRGRVSAAGWLWIDVATAVALLVGLTTPVLLGAGPGDDPPALVLALAAGATLPVAVRRRWPVAAMIVIVVAVTVAALAGIQTTPFGSSASPVVGLAMYTVAVGCGRRVSLAAVAAVATVTFGTAWIVTYTQSIDENAVHTAAAVIGWLIGETVRARRSYRADLAARRQGEADERTRRAIAEERLQISREVHDVVSHNLAVIAVRSGVGRMLFDTQPEAARQTLAEVESTSRDALAELRRLLATVRDREPLAPSPRLADLPALAEQVRAVGVDTTLETRGSPAVLPRTMELSAYRMVQEALTNVVTHAGPTRAHVVLDYRDDALVLEVTDDGPAAPPGGPPPGPSPGEGGWGIPGMRERAAMFGGTVVAGPRSEGGFRVTARLPVPATGDEGDR